MLKIIQGSIDWILKVFQINICVYDIFFIYFSVIAGPDGGAITVTS